MVDPGGTFLDKARESLTGARAELDARRYSNSANRSYYAVFQAAIHAILAASIRPPRQDDWDHGWIRSQFDGVLIYRRHRYSPDLRSVIGDKYNVRAQADYSLQVVTEAMATRALRRAERFVGAAVQREGQ